jgi:CBS-domain-containing membrane protein
MQVKDVMTRDVITVSPATPIHKAAQLMVDHGVSGLPVVDGEGAVVGIVSEGDLIVRQKPRPRPSWWRVFFDDGERLAREYRRAVGTTVGEVMTTDVITVGPEQPLESAALLLDRYHLRRLPVLEDGDLVGLVSRGDLIKALAAPPELRGSRSDAELGNEMRARMAREPWARNDIVIQARNGVLELAGVVETEAEKSALETMAHAIEGCRRVDSYLAARGVTQFPHNI